MKRVSKLVIYGLVIVGMAIAINTTTHLPSLLLTPRQYATLRIIVLILQTYRTIQIEKLASILPIPIKYESRRRHILRG